MANPVVVDVAKGGWVKVATNVLSGYIHILKRGVMYQQTYRLTGDAAPADQSEGAELDCPGAPISSIVGIDVYIYCTSGDGKIRVDV